MHFCPNCKFMVYTKLKDDNKNLLNYCKNCNWSGELENKNNLIYQRNYQEDYIADKVISNKYTIFDATLPRVSYTCVNNECITNLKNLDTEFIFMIHNIPADLSDEQVKQIFEDDKDSILRLIRIKLTTVVIEVKEVNQKEKLINKYNNMKSEFLDSNKLDITEFTTPKSEVIYIKYDSINMKYLYICSNCGTSWKNN
jgi:hypothetical protein